MHLSPPPPPVAKATVLLYDGGHVVDSLLIVTPIVGNCNCSMFCCTLLYVHSSFAIILMGKGELVVLLSFSSWCPVIAMWLFLAVRMVCLQFVILVFPNHTHLLAFDVPFERPGYDLLFGIQYRIQTRLWMEICMQFHYIFNVLVLKICLTVTGIPF